jgi:hypothetical protein
MAFYQLICTLYEGLERIPDEIVQGLILKEHIFQLLVHHKLYTDVHKVLIPETDPSFKKYIDDYTQKMIVLEPVLKEIVEKYKKENTNIGYIS